MNPTLLQLRIGENKNNNEEETNDNDVEGGAPVPRPILPPHKKKSEDMHDANHTGGENQYQWRQHGENQYFHGHYADDQYPQAQYRDDQYPQGQYRDDQYHSGQYRENQYLEGQDGRNQNRWGTNGENQNKENWTGTLSLPHGNDATGSNNPESKMKALEDTYIMPEEVKPILVAEMKVDKTLKGIVNYTNPDYSHDHRKHSSPATLGFHATPGYQMMEGPGTNMDYAARQQSSGKDNNYEEDYIEITS